MVRTLNQLAHELLELYRATYRVTDSIDIRLFKTWVQETRALLAKQRIDENMRHIDEHLVQDLGYVRMENVDSSTNVNYPSGRYICRSVNDLPAFLNKKGGIACITRIAPADKLEVNYNLVSYERALVSGNGKFNQNDIYAFLDGHKLCLISKTNIHKLIKYINVKGVFVNPEDAYEFTGGTWNDDMEYPVSEAIVFDMQSIILEKRFKFILTQVDDRITNGSDDAVNMKSR